MKKYQIYYKEPEISDEQMERHKNFLEVLGRYQEHKKGTARYGNLKPAFFALTLLMLLSAIWFVYEQHLEEPSLKQKRAVEIVGEKGLKAKEEQLPQQLGLQPNATQAGKDHIKDSEAGEKRLLEEIDQTKPEVEEKSFALTYTEALPTGGMQELYYYFNSSMIYPPTEMEAGVEGTVILSFTINTAGRAEHIEVLQPVSTGIDQEAIRLIEEMPDWTPASIKGEEVQSRVTLPLTFKIHHP